MATGIDPEDNIDIFTQMIDDLVHAVCPKPTTEQRADAEKRIEDMRYWLEGVIGVAHQTEREPECHSAPLRLSSGRQR